MRDTTRRKPRREYAQLQRTVRRTRKPGWLAAAAITAAALTGIIANTDSLGDAAATIPTATAEPPAAGAALTSLDALPIKGRAPKTGYSRALFGRAWSDDVTVAGGHNGCDGRNDILGRDLTDITFKPATNGCVVLSGTLHDPYTGKTIDFRRGRDASRAVQIDHVVPLSDAWQKGAQQWNESTRRNFANDPINLLAVDGPANERKGDGDAATWLPPNKAYRCTYATRIVAVKAAYRLWVTQAEHDALTRILSSNCA